jgi:hypothetical protein
VIAGVVVAVAIGAALVGLGGGIAASSNGDPFMSDRTLVGVWFAAAAAVGAFVGGRTAAAVGRMLARRDGVLAGLVTGSVLAVLGIAAGAWLATAWPASRAAELLWSVTAIETVFLVAAMLGGMSGARAEAKAIGLRSVRPSRRGMVVDSDYERDFFEGASLSSDPTTTGSRGIT